MMRVETYSRLGAIAGKYADEIVATSFENWPEAHVEHALARPAISVAISTAELDQLLDGNETRRAAGHRRAGALTVPSVLSSPPPAIDAFFPKLGPVSWKEVASLRSIPAEDAEMLLPVMFASITSRMAIILDAFVVTGAPTFLHLFPHIELSHFIEARMTIEKRQVVAAKWQRLPHGIVPNERAKAGLIDLATLLAQSASLPNMLIDLCFDTGTPNAAPRLLEINPDIPELRKGD